jgi:hypothetical protein
VGIFGCEQCARSKLLLGWMNFDIEYLLLVAVLYNMWLYKKYGRNRFQRTTFLINVLIAIMSVASLKPPEP